MATSISTPIHFEEFVTKILEKFPDKEWELSIIGSSHGDRFCATPASK